MIRIFSLSSGCDSWYPLGCKPGQNKTEYRGELEVKLGFTVRASESVGGSVADLSKKNKGSISSLNKVAGNIGGSLLSLGGKEKKNFKKIAASVTRKVEKVGGKAKKSVSSLKLVSREKTSTKLLQNICRTKTGLAWPPCLRAASGEMEYLAAREMLFRMKTLELTLMMRMTCSRYG